MKSTDLIKGTLFTNIFLQIFNYILELLELISGHGTGSKGGITMQ